MRRSLTILLLAAVACTGGGSGQTPGPELVRGVVTAVGSVTIAGTEYDTSDAELDLGPDTTELARGMKVTLEGVEHPGGVTGSASRVTYRPELRGPVEADPIVSGPERREFSILGQTVVIDRAETVFDGVAFDGVNGIGMGDVLEVSGLRDGYGAILATRVVSSTTPGVWLRGAVANLDTVGGSFEISGVEVDFDGATDLSGVPGGELANGDFVDVSGMVTAPDTVAADVIAIDAPALEGSGQNARIEGLVSELRGVNDFLVGGQPVNASALGVSFDPDLSLLHEGARVEVEGTLDKDGKVVARQVSQRDPNVRIQAAIAASEDVDPTARTLQLLGDIGVDVPRSARLVSSDPDFTNLGYLVVGDFLEVRGVAASGRVRATRVELLDASGSAKLTGPVVAFDSTGGTFTILGLQIPLLPTADDPDSETTYEAFPHDPALDERGDLFAYLSPGGRFLRVEDDADTDDDPTTLDDAGQVGPEQSIPVVIAAEVADGALDPAAPNRLTLLDGIVVQATFATSFTTCDAIPAFKEIGDLSAGDFVEVRGERRFGGIVRANSIQCLDPPRDMLDPPRNVRLRGRVETVAVGSAFTILGTAIATDASTTQFDAFPFDGSPGDTSESAFYDFLANHPTAVLDVTDEHDGDDTMIDLADTVTLSDYGD